MSFRELTDHTVTRSTERAFRIMTPSIFKVACLLGMSFLAACGARETPGAGTITGAAATSIGTQGPGRGIMPPHMENRDPVRVAILLPLGAESEDIRERAQSLFEAAQLALFDQSNEALLLVPKDTYGTPEGAAAAAREAVDQGAELILGPLFAPSVQAAAPVARAAGVPVVAFSTDRNVAGDGVYLLSFMPEDEIETVTRFAVSRGISRFAALIPEGPYGERVRTAFNDSVIKTGGTVTQVEHYVREPSRMFEPVKRIANYDARLAAIQFERRRLGEKEDEDSQKELELLEKIEVWGGTDYQAVLIPEEGNLLKSLAPLLAYYEVHPRIVKFLGTGLWDNPEIVREPSLQGGWFAAPSPNTYETFRQSFARTYGRAPQRIASLAYDAVTLAAALAAGPKGERFRQADITNPEGFVGVDGRFRLLPDGRSERGLAVLKVTTDGFDVIGAAPKAFEAGS